MNEGSREALVRALLSFDSSAVGLADAIDARIQDVIRTKFAAMDTEQRVAELQQAGILTAFQAMIMRATPEEAEMFRQFMAERPDLDDGEESVK